jgi:branched-chain amino acid transport system substrate-binding protein
MRKGIVCAICIAIAAIIAMRCRVASAQETHEPKVRIGVATILSGDLAVLGENARETIQTYQRHFMRHKIEFVFEDAKKSSLDGLRAFQSLINFEHVNLLIGPMTSNGIIAGAELINSTKTLLMTPSTGGSNIDHAGPFIFRIGNSDVRNGIQQAELFRARGLMKVGLLTEETEYTTDIASAFRKRFAEIGGSIVYDQTFLPDNNDFRSQIASLLNSKPQAIFVSTQTGQAFGVFVKQLRLAQPDMKFELHTNFIAASNPDAFTAAGTAIYGVYYMAPSYDHNNPELKKFLEFFKKDHGTEPPITFQAAGIVDSLNMLQSYLDKHPSFNSTEYQQWLLQNIKNYHGLMGEYSFDNEGNANIGFTEAKIEK